MIVCMYCYVPEGPPPPVGGGPGRCFADFPRPLILGVTDQCDYHIESWIFG